MQIIKCAEYDEFSCIAAACPDSCCHEWSIAVDPQAAEMYRNMAGPLGDRLRQVLIEEDGDTVFRIEDGRCPMWRSDGLCRIQAELGHDALCQTCRDFPRLRHDYGNFQELQLELSCPEAARLILRSPIRPDAISELSGGEAPDYDGQDMALLLQTRQECLRLLSDPGRPIGQRLALMLLYGYHAQALLDGGDAKEFDADAALEAAADMARPAELADITGFFAGLEVLTPRWAQRLAHPEGGQWLPEYENLARYFVRRYWLQAVSDLDLVSRVKLAVVSCILIRHLGGDLVETAQLYSKEIENDPENVDALLDAAYTSPAFTDDRLLYLLLKDALL